jgi:hypothetical protein
MISKKILNIGEGYLHFQTILCYFDSLDIQSDRNLPLRTTLFNHFFS